MICKKLTLICEALIYPSGFVLLGAIHTRLSSYGTTSLKRFCSRLRSNVATTNADLSRFLAICSNSTNSCPSSLLSSACCCQQNNTEHVNTGIVLAGEKHTPTIPELVPHYDLSSFHSYFLHTYYWPAYI